MAAVAVVVVALIAINLLPKTSSVGGPASTPAPTSTPAPAATSAPSPSPSPGFPQSGLLPAGSYQTDFGEGIPIRFTVPAGWSSADGSFVNRNGGDPPNGMAFTTWQIATVYNDPCRWQTTGAPVGPTVDELVAALVAQKRGATVTPVAVTVDGFSGKQLDLVVPLNVTLAACDGGQYKTWTDPSGGDRYNQGPGQHDVLDIVDVNGRTFVIQSSHFPANTAADLAELQSIVDSVTITPPAPAPTASAAATP